MKLFKQMVAVVMVVIMAFSCFAISAVAATAVTSVKIVELPNKVVYYKGRDWKNGYWKFGEGTEKGVFTESANDICFMYNGGYYSHLSDLGMLDLHGLVLEATYSDGSKKKVTYTENFSGNEVKQNIYFGTNAVIKAGKTVKIDVCLAENTSVHDSFEIAISEKAALKGDVNEDYSVNSSDALLALKHVVGLKTLEGVWFQTADLTGDNAVNSADALMILKIAVGK